MKPSTTLPPVNYGDHPLPPNADDYWHGLIDEKAAANFRGVTRRKMQKDRQTGNGPRYFRLSSRCVRYTRYHLREDAESRMRTSTSDPGRTPARGWQT